MKLLLDTVALSGFKSIRHADVPLKDLNVLIGPNGSGKSNFLSLFELINYIFRGDLQVYVGKRGADSLLHYGSQFTDSIKATLSFTRDNKSIWTYHFELQRAVNDTLIFADEAVRTDQMNKMGSVGKGHRESMISQMAPDMNPDFAERLKVIQFNYVHQFHDTSLSARVHNKCFLHDNIAVSPDARNLAAFLYRLKTEQTPYYKRIVSTIQLVAPFFGDFILEPSGENNEYILLRWQERGKDLIFGSHQLSDGTLRFIALCTLLMQPRVPPFLIIDEPELGLHPYAISILAGLLKAASQKSQVFVSTQSVSLIKHFSIDDLIVVERKDGQSVFERKNQKDFEHWLKDYNVGELWEMNVLGGRPS